MINCQFNHPREMYDMKIALKCFHESDFDVLCQWAESRGCSILDIVYDQNLFLRRLKNGLNEVTCAFLPSNGTAWEIYTTDSNAYQNAKWKVLDFNKVFRPYVIDSDALMEVLE